MSETVNVRFKGATPTYAHEGDAGFDLVAAEDVVIEPGETALVRTGLSVELPIGYELQVRQRSGITLKTKLRVQLGTIDSTYRGEVGVIVDNTKIRVMKHVTDRVNYYLNLDGTLTDTPTQPREDKWLGNYNEHEKVAIGTYIVRKGDRIAQAVIQRLPSVQFTKVDELSGTARGDRGYGSTGVREGD